MPTRNHLVPMVLGGIGSCCCCCCFLSPSLCVAAPHSLSATQLSEDWPWVTQPQEGVPAGGRSPSRLLPTGVSTGETEVNAARPRCKAGSCHSHNQPNVAQESARSQGGCGQKWGGGRLRPSSRVQMLQPEDALQGRGCGGGVALSLLLANAEETKNRISVGQDGPFTALGQRATEPERHPGLTGSTWLISSVLPFFQGLAGSSRSAIIQGCSPGFAVPLLLGFGQDFFSREGNLSG